LPDTKVFPHGENYTAWGETKTKGGLNAQEIKDLSDELAALAKKQSDARETEICLRMTPQEIKDFDDRQDRISRIYVILGDHDSKRESTRIQTAPLPIDPRSFRAQPEIGCFLGPIRRRAPERRAAGMKMGRSISPLPPAR
jgi:hypothetical protein